jgi:hypothetical protein
MVQSVLCGPRRWCRALSPKRNSTAPRGPRHFLWPDIGLQAALRARWEPARRPDAVSQPSVGMAWRARASDEPGVRRVRCHSSRLLVRLRGCRRLPSDVCFSAFRQALIPDPRFFTFAPIPQTASVVTGRHCSHAQPYTPGPGLAIRLPFPGRSARRSKGLSRPGPRRCWNRYPPTALPLPIPGAC